MSEIKKKIFDMTTVLSKVVTVSEIPRRMSGRQTIDWKPLLKVVMQKGTIKISEDDIIIGSAANGVREEAKRQNIEIVTNTRKIDGKLYLFIQKPIKR